MTDRNGRRSIKQLPPLIVNQIAAGEVIERPASVVKELIDNAIDAGAARISIDLERGGIELIRVTDDGGGIPAEELELAITPHATSKIRDVEDLDRIGTMGFRGEALPSIVSVARVSIRSRTPESTQAHVLEGEGADVQPVKPAAGPVGTSVTMRNLFFNTPARRKFLRTPQTEKNHCIALVESLAMSHSAIGFALTSDGKPIFDLAPGQSPKQRLLQVLGTELRDQLIEASGEDMGDQRGVSVWGLVGLPTIARSTQKYQHVFLNGRPIRDRTIQHALREAYRGLIEPSKHPTAALMIEMDPSAVDVNVHPAKIEVRFRDSSMVHQMVLRSVRDALRASDLTPDLEAVSPNLAPPAAGVPSDATASSTRRIGEWLKASAPASTQERISFAELKSALETEPPPVQTTIPAPTPTSPILQVHNSFLVTQDEQGLLIIDQHALHERVMFEQLYNQVVGENGQLERQSLLVPAVVELSRTQMSTLDDMQSLFARLGIEATPLGPTSLGIQTFPTFLFERNVEAGPFVQEIFMKAEADGFAPNSEQAMHEVLDMMACKAAVKAGDRMSQHELRRLLELREEVERSSNCPHGRPTSIRLSVRELERRFGRG